MLGSIIGAIGANAAARKQAKAQVEAAKIAADAAKFRPYALTTGFGSSAFDTENQTATYELDPRLQAMRDQYYGLGEQALGGVELDPTKAAEAYYSRQQGLLAPTRQAQDIALRQNQLGRGRLGLGISSEAMGAGAGGMVNPEQYQRDLARARADAELAAGSYSQAQADIDRNIARGSGLLQSGFGVENLGMGALTMGADIGNKAQVSGGQQAQALLSGGQNAAQANLAGDLSRAKMYQNIGQQFDGMFSGGGTPNWLNNIQQGYTNSADYGGYGYGSGYQGVY